MKIYPVNTNILSKLGCISLGFSSVLLLKPSESLASEFRFSQTFTMPDVTTTDQFGQSVALDGNNVLIGAPENQSDGDTVGRAYLFTTNRTSVKATPETSSSLTFLTLGTIGITLTIKQKRK